ncbi:MAG: sigma-70 family RNA polymerase sigma factor [Planctomycetota bacterium]
MRLPDTAVEPFFEVFVAVPDLSEFDVLVAEADRGSEEAVWELVERFSPHVYRVVRRRMQPSLRQRFDSTDFVQMTWASFLLRDRELSAFGDETKLCAYLAGIAKNKVLIGARKTLDRPAQNAKREVTMEHPEAVALSASTPLPDEVTAFRDAWDQHLAAQPARHREIVELRLTGLNCKEVGAEVGVNERTVRRVLKSLCAAVLE